MATNPMVPQGTLNRLRGSFAIVNFPALNVPASYLGKAGISLTFDGEATTYIPTMTGAVTSPEPYQMVTVEIPLLKTQGLAQQYETQKQLSTLLGDSTVYTDSSALPQFDLINTSIGTIKELKFGGEDAGYVVEIKGYTLINSSLWDLL